MALADYANRAAGLVAPCDQQVDAASGRTYSTPLTVFNRQTGQLVQAGVLLAGMTTEAAPGGKPVYKYASGNRFWVG